MKIKILLLISLISLTCKSQELKVHELSKNSEMAYIFSRISTSSDLIIHKELYQGGMFAKIFYMLDPQATPKDYSKGTEEFLTSYIISINPDGDYYVNTKLYKIEGLSNPKILEIKGTIYPNFEIKIEYGIYDNRKTKSFELIGPN